MLNLRRAALSLCASLLMSAVNNSAYAQEDVWRNATSLVGEPKYEADFKHFDYVNPDAPKGGKLRLSESGGFDTLNPFPAKGELATGVGLVYETLTMRSLDEISTNYGLLAEAISYPDDYSSVKYRLRENARWHDGTPVTAEDVVWSFKKTIELAPDKAFYYQHVEDAKALDARTVEFTFDEKNNRELPQIVGEFLVLPKHWWEDTNAKGEKRDISASSLEPPLGSGPYKVGSLVPGASITFERVKDYWGENEAVNIGTNNFDIITYTYYRDLNVEFQAFKADRFDFWSENAAKRWATAYDFPAVDEGRVVRITPDNDYRAYGVLVGFIPNLRLDKFKDARVRRALNYAFDYETLNNTIFYNQYQRIDSFYFGLEFDSSDALPTGKELEYLNQVRDLVPPSVFTEVYKNPVAGDQQKLRANLREALRLFKEASYEQRGGKLVNSKTGEPFKFEVLLNGPTIEAVALPWAEDLRKIGIDITIRSVEASQYVERLRNRDFEIVYSGWGQSASLGNEQIDYFGSEAADKPGSKNYGGIADAAVDQLIKNVVFAKNRADLVAASRALDRVMMANQFVIPSYTNRNLRIAYWNRFSYPEGFAEYSIGFPTIWWFDEVKAAKTQ